MTFMHGFFVYNVAPFTCIQCTNSYSFNRGIFLDLFMYFIQHCFICRPSDSTVSQDAGIDPGLLRVATSAMAVRRSNHSARSQPLFCIFFGGLECIGHSYSSVAHLVFLRDFWIRTIRELPYSKQARYQLSHPSP
jgi:hypothetical protein